MTTSPATVSLGGKTGHSHWSAQTNRGQCRVKSDEAGSTQTYRQYTATSVRSSVCSMPPSNALGIRTPMLSLKPFAVFWMSLCEHPRKHKVGSCLRNLMGILASTRRDFQQAEVEKQLCIQASHKHNDIENYRECDLILLEVSSSENNLSSSPPWLPRGSFQSSLWPLVSLLMQLVSRLK